MIKFSLGCLPEPPDSRDLFVPIPRYDLPQKVDWTSQVTAVKNQGDEGCHDENTEILTNEGWKKFSELNKHEQVATVNPETNMIEFQKPKRYFGYDYDGKIFHLSGRRLDCKITSQHSLWIRKWNERERRLSLDFEFLKARNLGWYSGLLCSLNWKGKSKRIFHLKVAKISSHNQKFPRKGKTLRIPMADWVQFLGIYLAEGCVNLQKPGCYRIEIATCEGPKRKRIEEILQRIPFHFHSYKDRFTCWNKGLYQELLPLGQATKKYIPNYAKILSQKQLQFFLESFAIGDGHATNDGRRWLYTSSRSLADDLLELILKTGRWGSIITRKPRTRNFRGRQIRGSGPSYVIAIYRTNHFSIQRKDQLRIENYKGKTYCVEAPNHLLLTRRNGKPIVTGNSCVGFAATALKEFQEWREFGQKFDFSERWIYEMAKEHDEWPGTDYQGTSIRGAMKALQQHGICPEDLWPYTAGSKGIPDPLAAQEAYKFRIQSYRNLTHPQKNIKLVVRGLHETGPVVAAFAVHETWFDVSPRGIIAIPTPDAEIVGYHAVLLVGYSHSAQVIKIKNSWGTEWGQEGFGYLDLKYAMATLHTCWAAYDLNERR